MDDASNSRLELRIEDASEGRRQLRLLVDGRDLLDAGFALPIGPDPRSLLGPYSPLLPGPEPGEVRLHVAACTEYCCGALYMTVRQESGAVVWDGWRNPDLKDLDLPAYRFDAAQYLAELDRAGTGVEDWPARGVGRLVQAQLVRRPELLAAWECEFDAVWTWPSGPDRIDLTFFWRPAVPDRLDDSPYLQFQVELTVPAGDPVELAADLVDRLTSADPCAQGRVCGGSPAYAEQLGHPWPEDM
ncbi:hypothetical protein [Kitasatospora sp. CB01950]|uniref:hypothetical protein n=1 Tax=Kitasatospora sp. CB01950 TaxID=1703930 RepID=UPI00093B7B9E|nr:hypothetical protein [Kitasatospora sp. CB01950]